MSASITRLHPNDGVFTDVEHAVLAPWFGREPTAAAASIQLDDALKELGFNEPCYPYRPTDAAVAHILLETIEDRLPVWAFRKDGKIIYSRGYREPHQKPRRQAALLPGKLFTINWATSGPGYDWPVRYHLTWVPLYDRFVVTASADCPDAFGYADFALGKFARCDDVGEAAIEIIKRDWVMQRDECNQARWEDIVDAGLITEDAARQLGDAVWPAGNDEADVDGDEPETGS
jgi:hypothetical protein